MSARRAQRTSKRSGARIASRAISILLAAGVIGLLIGLMLHDGAMAGVQHAYATVTNALLRLFGTDTDVLGNVVGSSRFAISVVAACTGLFATALFLVAVLVFPTTWRAKLLGCAIGIGGLALINVVRLASLYYVGVHWPAILDAVHQLVWQSLLIVFAIALWLIWAGRIAGPRRMAR